VKIVFGCGGTGGHIYPALALAREFKAQGHTAIFIGNRDGMEADLVKRSGYIFHPIRVRKLDRRLDLSLLSFPFLLIFSIVKCLSYYHRTRPDAVICTGGFVSGPVAIAAILGRIPLFFHESNSLPGLTTRCLARYTRLTFVSWPAAMTRLKGAPLRLVGIPLLERANDSTSADLGSLGIDVSKPVILVTGGSQGSLMINRAVDGAVESIQANGWQLIWQTGQSGYREFSTRHKDTPGVHIFAFSPQLPMFYRAAAVAVSRAGAMTIAEQESYRCPAILIPLPTAAENHQYYNAIEQQKKGVALCLEQKDLNADSLIAVIKRMMQRRDSFLDQLATLPPNTAAADICSAILDTLAKETHYAR